MTRTWFLAAGGFTRLDHDILTHLLSVVPTVIEKQLVLGRDVLGGAEIDLPIVRISHQILLFPIPKSAQGID